jgi:hypothetical protein
VAAAPYAEKKSPCMEIFRGKASRKISMQAHTPRRGAYVCAGGYLIARKEK